MVCYDDIVCRYFLKGDLCSVKKHCTFIKGSLKPRYRASVAYVISQIGILRSMGLREEHHESFMRTVASRLVHNNIFSREAFITNMFSGSAALHKPGWSLQDYVNTWNLMLQGLPKSCLDMSATAMNLVQKNLSLK